MNLGTEDVILKPTGALSAGGLEVGGTEEAEFDPIAYINRMFPNEESLTTLEENITKLKVRVRKLDGEILKTVRSQTSSAERGRSDLDEARRAIAQLFERMASISVKAEKSERIVQEICRDIKTLDYAKKHIQMTIAALRRMHMFISFIDQLEGQVNNFLHEEAATSLEGIEILRQYFEPYQSVDKVGDLLGRLERLKLRIRKRIMDDFSVLHESRTDPPKELAAECLVVDALGEEAKTELISWFVEIQLAQYRTKFSLNSDDGRLARVDRRYAWLWRFLRLYEGAYLPIFPRHWRVDERLCVAFANDTRKSLTELLDQERRSKMNVSVLLHALQATVEHEGTLSTRFAASTPLSEGEPPTQFVGMISRAFEPYLSYYIDAEVDKLREFFQKSTRRKESWESTDIGTAIVFSSCNELFVYIKQMTLRCSSLTHGRSLLNLSLIVIEHIGKYSEYLAKQMPSDPTIQMLPVICLILNTAEYAEDISKQFADSLVNDLESDFGKKIDISPIVEKFANVSAGAVVAILSVLEETLKDPLDALSRTKWIEIENVREESEFLSDLMNRYHAFMVGIHSSISEKYFRFIVDKVTAKFISLYAGAIARLKYDLTRIGAEQLLLDTAAILKSLLTIESLAGNRIYEKLVTNELEKISMALQDSLMGRREGDSDGGKESVKYASMTSVKNLFTKLSLN